MSTYADRERQPLLANIQLHKKTRDFLNKLSRFDNLLDNTILVTLDVAAVLYHSIPYHDGITIGNAEIPFKQSVKNLGFTLDCHLTINAHVSNIARTYYFELRRLASIHRFLKSTATVTIVSAFVLSRIDYCNSNLTDTELCSLSNLVPSNVI